MHRAILCIGSNYQSAHKLIEHAIIRLSEMGAGITARSNIYTVSLPYYNCVVDVTTDLGADDLVILTKGIEREMGRRQDMKAMSLVPIDIDVVVFDGLTLRPSDYSADYFRAGLSCVNNENSYADRSKF